MQIHDTMHRKTATIHAGSSGSGDFQLQSALGQLAANLLQAGTILPLAGRTQRNVVNHSNLVFSLMGNPNFNPRQGGIEEWSTELDCSGTSNIVISSPFMPAVIRTPKALARLRETLISRGFHIHWVLYLRTYEDLLQNLYVEQLLAGRTALPCDPWVRKNKRQLLAEPHSVFSPLFQLEDDVSLRSFAQVGGDVAADFLSLLGLPHLFPKYARPSEEPPEHPSLRIRFYQLLARFAERYLNQAQTADLLARARHAESFLPESPSFLGIQSVTATSIRDETRASYERLLSMAGIEYSFDEFLPPLQYPPAITQDTESEAILYQTFVRCALDGFA